MSQILTAVLDSAAAESKLTAPSVDDEDLEDGEIDTDDENEAHDDSVEIISVTLPDKPAVTAIKNDKGKAATIEIIDLVNDNATTTKTTSKKPQPVEDDFASNIENAIASALKKKGIEPPMPKLDTNRNGQSETSKNDVQSRSSRRRKRKKEREKDRKEKRKRYQSPDKMGTSASAQLSPPPLNDDEDLDEYEMLNMRGGSPPPMTHLPPPLPAELLPPPLRSNAYDDSEDDSIDDSYDSYDDSSPTEDNRRSSKRSSKRDSKKSSSSSRRNRDEKRSRNEKRNRHDSDDDSKHRQEPRKMELCKFYLMECCAKKDKCSYMHSEFPCKYYYLGMECVVPKNEQCKFAHGEPLSEELRNILLKHLETAPKEILGNFKRLSRENSMSQMRKRHDELCKQFKKENIWKTPTGNNSNSNNNNSNSNGNNNQNARWQQNNDNMLQHQQQQHQQQQMHHEQYNNNPFNSIPSLLDMVIKPPADLLLSPTHNNKNNGNNSDKQRKTRWTEYNDDNSNNANNKKQQNISKKMPVSDVDTTSPSHLDLHKLTDIISAEKIDKLSQLGITNFEQVNQLTFGQLNEIGLTIAEITKIQLELQKKNNEEDTAATASTAIATAAAASSNTETVQKDEKPEQAKPATNDKAMEADKDAAILPLQFSNEDMDSNSNSNSTSHLLDFMSQYYKDSNIGEDDQDDADEQLVIDVDIGQQQQMTEDTKSISNTQRSPRIEPTNMPLFDIKTTLQNPFKMELPYNAARKEQPLKDQRTIASNYASSTATPFTDFAGYNSNSDDDIETTYFMNKPQQRAGSHTPTRSHSRTPEASPSPPLMTDNELKMDAAEIVYERKTIYDVTKSQLLAEQQNKEQQDNANLGSQKEFDMHLPFEPMMNYTPATEIEGSIATHLPMAYTVCEVEIPTPNYAALRKTNKTKDIADPRLRRILGLPELCASMLANVHKKRSTSISSSIASPEYEMKSPNQAASGSSNSSSSKLEEVKKTANIATAVAAAVRRDPRRDPRAAAAATASSTPTSTATTAIAPAMSAGTRQNTEIRNILQKSEWYHTLNSKFKIMVNQQLALVSTELKKFHQDTMPNKIFDIAFIVNNVTLQQILTNLGIFIDDNGEVSQLDVEEQQQLRQHDDNGLMLPNLSQPPPNQQQLNFLRNPPPNMPPQLLAQQMFRAVGNNNVASGAGVPAMNPMNPFATNNPRPSLLGLPPGVTNNNGFNAFANNMPDMNMNANFMPMGGPNAGLLGPGPGPVLGPGPMPFNNFNMQQQRNFNNNNNQRRQRNQQNRRNNQAAAGGGNGVGANNNRKI